MNSEESTWPKLDTIAISGVPKEKVENVQVVLDLL